MDIPEHLMRFPTAEAVESLARLFNLPNHAHMQDWEFEVADGSRTQEFLSAYESLSLSDDEKFVLMQVMLQSFDDIGETLAQNVAWQRLLFRLEQDIEIHISTVWYWAALDSEDPSSAYTIAPYMREILGRHRQAFEAAEDDDR